MSSQAAETGSSKIISDGHKRKPDWLRIPVRGGENLQNVKALLKRLHLNTVCVEANCPNRMECFSSKTATFMILGSVCTRDCRFCDVKPGVPSKVLQDEPERLAEAVKELGLEHVVITSVTRDDLPDGGAAHFAETIRAVKSLHGGDTGKERDCEREGDTGKVGPIHIEVLIPDFKGDYNALSTVADSKPEIINHNIETVPRLYKDVRPQAVYKRSLELLGRVKKLDPSIYTKSGIMVGLGESREEVETVMDDLREVGCDFLTIGQYLPPSKEHYPLQEYIHPEQFARYRTAAYAKGFSFVASAPFVRSSYKAGEALNSKE